MSNDEGRWLKATNLVIAGASLVAAVFSAVAAWNASDVANDSLELSRQIEARSDSAMSASPSIGIKGRCSDAANPLTVSVYVGNGGKLPGKITGVFFRADLQPTEAQKKAMPNANWSSVLGTSLEEGTVDPFDSAEVKMQIDCNKLSKVGIDPAKAGEDIVYSVEQHTKAWYVMPLYAYGGKGFGERVTHAYYEN
ncbi:hypothetical protein [Mycobacterium sp. SA01]|uniref:hypothetical protein n=1 Tax=Mycobacterium sp. SA01 TaxID=3238820 RepID=UPI00351B1ECE